ncbi:MULTISPECIES: hypothetical protein [unclassified Streptomyces]|uniref:hypothetical protein n=1 Tax=unclassified Streptomyces TaxID=2593676 RepID=UPI002E1889B6|nr:MULTISPECIES: hypothetical protein [unclassified Streptomyces]
MVLDFGHVVGIVTLAGISRVPEWLTAATRPSREAVPRLCGVLCDRMREQTDSDNWLLAPGY